MVDYLVRGKGLETLEVSSDRSKLNRSPMTIPDGPARAGKYNHQNHQSKWGLLSSHSPTFHPSSRVSSTFSNINMLRASPSADMKPHRSVISDISLALWCMSLVAGPVDGNGNSAATTSVDDLSRHGFRTFGPRIEHQGTYASITWEFILKWSGVHLACKRSVLW